MYNSYGPWMARFWDQVLRTHFILPARPRRGVHAFLRAIVTICIFVGASLSVQSEAAAAPRYSGIVMDAKTGRILYSHRANDISYPASLTKMMTLYMMFEALENGKLSKKTRIRMSKFAASKPPSRLGIKPGRSLSAEQAIYALVTKSANDVAAAVAEHLGGSERNFAVRMTKRARQLGMHRTVFRNASGLTAKGQVTSAKDMALLGIALREHYPRYYRYFSTRSFKYGKANYGNHNRLLGKVKGVDGIKTGYTRLSGFNLVSSVRLNNRSIVAVVMGGKSGKSRNAQMKKLIAKYLRKATKRKKRGVLVARLHNGKSLRSAGTRRIALALPKQGPIPVFRAQNNDPVRLRIEQAHVASLAYAPQDKEISRRNIDAIRNKLLAMGNAQAPVPQLSPIATPDFVRTASIRPKIAIGLAPIKTKLNVRPAGWHVQIGAVPSQKSALVLLSKARKKMPTLANAKTYGQLRDFLEAVVKNGETLYRARFAGFTDKSSARAACVAMKKRKIRCLAINSQ